MKKMTTGTALRRVAGVSVAAIAAVSLVACSSGGSSSGGGSADDIEAALEAGGEITYWAWAPSSADQVAAFEAEYPNVTVNLVNAGTSADQYTALQNAIMAGSGAPDVAQIEYYAMPQFALTGGLLDLTSFGFGDLEADYSASTWGSVALDGGIYGLPQDSGPMAMFYNATIFDEFGLEVPTTWDEYIEVARQLHEADPTKYITSDSGDAGFTQSMIWQAGGRPYSTTDGTDVTIDLNDAGATEWAEMWQTLIDEGLLSDISGWSNEWFTGLGNGTLATLVTGAWMPSNFESSVPQSAGEWRVAPMPTYDGGEAVSAENGGSAQAVLAGTENAALAAGFLKWLNNSDESVNMFVETGGFPATTATLNSEEFQSATSEYFGGQAINEVLVAASESVGTGWQYLPFQVYANSIFNDTVGEAYNGSTTLTDGLMDWQDQLVEYGNSQGFSVNQ
ncbi:sugar ABC transporter substrate-binding protein [Microbacterium sediminicola]|uniref:Sugar ABC transporter substrate-binding protein n=1 Tax=Microbacterium sediminicola TaxID=415210 RepID=A0ABP4U9H7_9MICO